MHSARFEQVQALTRSGPFRLALAALAVLTPAAALFAAFIGWQVNQILADRTLESLRSELLTLRTELDRGGIPALVTAVNARSTPMGRALYHLEVGAPPSGLTAGNLKAMPLSAMSANSVFRTFNAADGTYHTAVGLVVPVPDGQLLIARDIEDQRALADTLQRTAFAGVGLLSLLALGFGWLASRRMAHRVSAVAATTQSIMAGDLSQRLPSDASRDELDLLASSVNAMLARIEDLMGALREVSDNIAHDLKTPLTRLRNRAEAALRDGNAATHRDGLEKVIEESDGLIQTFNALLLIARLEAGAIDATCTRCDLAELVSDVGELYQPVADEAGLTIVIEAPTPAPLAINRHLVGQAVANLLDNAIKYSAGTATAATGPITLSVTPLSATSVEIAVADRGPGIPPADRDRATKRFVRLEQSRSRPGTGLGLSLVAAVARLHGGTVCLADNAPGLRIVLVLAEPAGPRAAVVTAGATNRATDVAPVSASRVPG